ncbi:MAG: GIY-YIG nuclease family protein [Patescibacteria group bacterium]
MLRCADNSLYCGWTTNLEKRLQQHNEGKVGAKYTRSRRPVELMYHEKYESRSAAMQREAEVKGWSKQKKELLCTDSIIS